MNSQWLLWAQKLQAIAQTGLHYKNHPFDSDRYEQILQIANAMLAAQTNLDPGMIHTLTAADYGHVTPKIEVRGIVFQDEKILLVQEHNDGFWAPPGGWADIGEPPSQGVEREVFEESGFQTKATKLLAVYDRNHPRHGHTPALHHSFKLFFRCDLVGGSPTLSYETTAIDFFSRDHLPPLSQGRVVASQIDRFFEHLYHPDWPTDFD
jgi:ADP-ribose pyrophosphatase YjhB (NUDIX family)